MTVPMLLDTDLGSDVDDELALALLWGSPEVDLLGVCTSYGDSALRARIALRMAELTGRHVDVAAGATATRSGREVWWAGHEGAAYDALPSAPTGDGIALLADRAGSAQLLAISPLTSVAAALDAGARFAGITIMGGDWADPAVGEHNLASDSAAATRVLGCGLPITVVGLDVTRRVVFDEREVRRIGACGRLGAIIATEMRSWMARWDEAVEVPHDPLTALALLEPALFAFAEPCAVEVSDGSDDRPEGAVRRLPEPGTVRVATDVDVEGARAAMADRIVAGLAGRGARTVPR